MTAAKKHPESTVERLQTSRKMLADCRDFLASDPEFAHTARDLETAIAIIDQKIKSKVN